MSLVVNVLSLLSIVILDCPTEVIFLSTTCDILPVSSLIATLKFNNSFLVVGASVYLNFAPCTITNGTAISKLLLPGYVVIHFQILNLI